MGISIKIALKFLKSSKGQTLLIALGIAIGVSVQIFIGLLIQGLQQSLINKTIGNSPQITVTASADDKLIADWNLKVDEIKLSDKRIKSLFVSEDASVYIKYDEQAEPALIRGIVPDTANNIYGFNEAIYEGHSLNADNDVLVGKDLKDKLGLKLGDQVRIANAAGKTGELKVVGFYDLKVSAVNKSWIIAKLEYVQQFLGTGNKVTSIEMQVEEPFEADAISEVVKNQLNKSMKDSGLVVDNWKAQNQQLLSGLSGQGISSLMIQVFVMISVVLGIASVLAISVMQKSKQIGILKAMGVKDRTASRIFIVQGLVLGIIGALAGVVLGILLILAFTTFAVNPDGTPVVPVYLNYWFIALSAGIAVAAAVVASIIPAGKSSKLSPIEVIRNG